MGGSGPCVGVWGEGKQPFLKRLFPFPPAAGGIHSIALGMAKGILTSKAIEDILEIYACILERDGEDQAGVILNRLERKAYGRDTLAPRAKFPEEPVPFGNRTIREMRETPWRIF